MEKLEPLTKTTVKEVDHGPNTRVLFGLPVREEEPEVMLRPGGGGRSLTVAGPGLTAMARFAGFPAKLPTVLTPDTMGKVATELLGAKKQYNAIIRDGVVVDFVHHAHRPVNTNRLLILMEKVMGETEFQRVLIMGQHRAVIDASGPKEDAVVVGDLVRAGVSVNYDHYGAVEPNVEAFVWRLACLNGATSPISISDFHYGGGNGGGDGSDIYDWFRESMRKAFRAFKGIVDRYHQLASEGLDPHDRAQLLEALIKNSGIRDEKLIAAIRARAIEDPPTTAWGMYNIMTWANTHLLEEPRQVLKARHAYHEFSDELTHSKLCPTCHRSN